MLLSIDANGKNMNLQTNLETISLTEMYFFVCELSVSLAVISQQDQFYVTFATMSIVLKPNGKDRTEESTQIIKISASCIHWEPIACGAKGKYFHPKFKMNEASPLMAAST